jgi:hypothetical protein
VLSFDNATNIQTVVLSIKERNEGTFPKTFTVALSNPTGNATLGTPSSLTITITSETFNAGDSILTDFVGFLGLLGLGIVGAVIFKIFNGGADVDGDEVVGLVKILVIIGIGGLLLVIFAGALY